MLISFMVAIKKVFFIALHVHFIYLRIYQQINLGCKLAWTSKMFFYIFNLQLRIKWTTPNEKRIIANVMEWLMKPWKFCSMKWKFDWCWWLVAIQLHIELITMTNLHWMCLLVLCGLYKYFELNDVIDWNWDKRVFFTDV